MITIAAPIKYPSPHTAHLLAVRRMHLIYFFRRTAARVRPTDYFALAFFILWA